MNTYSVYYHEALPLDGTGLVLIREKFNWFAFFLPFFWALRYQLWIALLTYVVLSVVVQVALEYIQAGILIGIVFAISFRLVFAYASPHFRQMKLLRLGYREMQPVFAVRLEEAERLVLNIVVDGQTLKTENSERPPGLEGEMDQVNDYDN